MTPTDLEEDLKRDLAHLRLELTAARNDANSLENVVREKDATIEGLRAILEAQSRLLDLYQVACPIKESR